MVVDRHILLRPLLTEKGSRLEESQDTYTFQVDKQANKIEIKRAVEKKFNVKVSNVRTANVKGKRKEMTVRSGGHVIRTSGKRSNWKKAMVTLQSGFTIDLYGAESEA
ncbi:MAG: 50S ribosomal protein L23 [Candidatus Neomarinimicrobiota bacterium]